ncbi:hypothetical protein AB0K35_28330 [Micromonospora sp. NPDC053740]|uniref:hypothetical protein n=1 Tax=Micromonospora sp. NPDC053740 TaxID=3155173 RepID=UPI003416E841
MTGAIKAITVREPWASCIVTGAKTVENRASGTKWRGLLFIHTSQQTDDAALFDVRVRHALNITNGSQLAFERGAVIAVVDLIGVHEAVTIPALIGGPGSCCAPWGERWHSARPAKHLVLANVRPLAKPVPCRGALGLWTPPEDVTAQVMWQIPTVVTR